MQKSFTSSQRRPLSSSISTLYRPQEINIEDFYQPTDERQQFRPDLKMKTIRKTITEKLSGSGCNNMPNSRMSNGHLDRITSAEQFKLRKETDFLQVKPYSKLYFSQQPVSVNYHDAQESMKSKQEKLNRATGRTGVSSIQRQNPSDQRTYYRSQMSGHSRRVNELFASQSGNVAPQEDLYSNFDKKLLKRSGILD